MEENLSYTPEEVARILKITRFTVNEMIKRGDLPAYRIGRKVRVEAKDLEQYVHNRKSTGKREGATPVSTPGTSGLSLDDEIVFCGQDVILDILTTTHGNLTLTMLFLMMRKIIVVRQNQKLLKFLSKS